MSFLQEMLCGTPPSDSGLVCKSAADSPWLNCPEYWRQQIGIGPEMTTQNCQAAVTIYGGGTIPADTMPQIPSGGTITGYGPAYDAQEEIRRQQESNQMYVILALATVAAVFFLGGKK